MIELTKIAYAAGMVDGDGTIQIMGRKNEGAGSYVVRVSIANASDLVPLWFQNVFGGNVYKFIMSKARRQPSFRWVLEAKSSLPFIKMIEPFLVEKRERAKLAIDYLERLPVKRFRKIPDLIAKERSEFYMQMKALNAKHSRSFWDNPQEVNLKEPQYGTSIR